MLTLQRGYLPFGTFGQLLTEAGSIYATVERPWLNNLQKQSCIPEGRYLLKMRDSDVVKRTTHGRFTRGWEITNVQGRTYIMFHVANWPKDLEGCIGIGDRITQLGAEIGVTNSGLKFAQFMAELAAKPSWELLITSPRAILP